MRRVVITGIGMINALGNDKETSFKNIVDGQTGISTIKSFDTEGLSVTIAGEVKDFDPKTEMNPKDVKKSARFIHLGFKSANEAMEDANIQDYNSDRFGISSASGIGGLDTIEANVKTSETKGPRRISPFFIPASLVNMLGGFISIKHSLKGPNVSSVTACAAGTHAIIEATKTIMLDGADQMLVITSESAICKAGIGGFASMKALSTRNDAPEKASRPFDAERDGFIMGEGSGSLVLEEYESAKARGAKIYGEIIGFGESSDANHITSPVVDGPYRAINSALTMAKKLKNEEVTIDYINAHGTSTPANDKNETSAIKMAFEGKEIPPISSTKGQTGHCLGAAGGIEAVISLMSMERSIIPPTINYENKDENCDLDYVPNQAREKKLETVMSNSFGFGGTNGVVIFSKKYL
jgi:3-oxoacyl-[acyl-carrier-protein] synthase II